MTPKFRPAQGVARFWIQAALIAALLSVFAIFAIIAAGNISRQSFHFGFAFFWEPAGFSILQTLIPYNESSSIARAFVVGLLNTLLVAAIGITGATILGFAVGLGRLSENRLLRWLCAGYVETLRNLPLLLILFFWYFGILRQLPPPHRSLIFEGAYLNNRGLFLPSFSFEGGSTAILLLLLAAFVAAFAWRMNRARRLLALASVSIFVTALLAFPPQLSWPARQGLSVAGGVQLIPELLALALALIIYTAAYIAEIVRAGIQSVSVGQKQAARALGFSAWQTARYVVLPQALRLILPPLTSQFLNLTKNSSLAVAIAYPDLVSVFAGTVLAKTGQALEIIAITMGVYLLLSLVTAVVLNSINARRWA